jgi:hypothetical protein
VALASEPEAVGQLAQRLELADAVARRIHAQDIERAIGRRPSVIPDGEANPIDAGERRLDSRAQLDPAVQIVVGQRILEPAKTQIIERSREDQCFASSVDGHRIHHQLHIVANRLSNCVACCDVDANVSARMQLDGLETIGDQLIDHGVAGSSTVARRRAGARLDSIALAAE